MFLSGKSPNKLLTDAIANGLGSRTATWANKYAANNAILLESGPISQSYTHLKNFLECLIDSQTKKPLNLIKL